MNYLCVLVCLLGALILCAVQGRAAVPELARGAFWVGLFFTLWLFSRATFHLG